MQFDVFSWLLNEVVRRNSLGYNLLYNENQWHVDKNRGHQILERIDLCLDRPVKDIFSYQSTEDHASQFPLNKHVVAKYHQHLEKD